MKKILPLASLIFLMHLAVHGQMAGEFDSNFGNNGTVFTQVSLSRVPFTPGSDFLHDIGVFRDGKIIVSAFAGGLAQGQVLIRYKPNGQLDSTYSFDGLLYPYIPSEL